MTSDPKLRFFFESPIELKDRSILKRFIINLFKREKRKLSELTYIFTSDQTLLKLNKEYLSHNYLTDILTFDLSSDDSVSAEIYISVDRVRENALKEKVSIKEELHRVIFHGALHLCGYKDKTGGEKRRMREKEETYLDWWGSYVSREKTVR